MTSVEASINTLWILLGSFLVFLMQAGFAILESGFVRQKNTQNILLKNGLDVCIGTILWWLIGYGFAYGKDENNFIGNSLYINNGFENTNHYRDWLFQWAFANTAATIVSGSLAERTKIAGYFIFSIFMTAFIYPVVVHWTWGGGWLSDFEFIDFAGSGIVHTVGGVAGLVGTIILGKRIERFEKDTKDNEFKPHSVPLVVLGTFLLWFGWYGFNCVSTLDITGNNIYLAAKIAVNTTLGAACGGISTLLFSSYLSYRAHNHFKYEVASLYNGILAGLVSITASCDAIEPWAAVTVGSIGGLVFLGFSKLLIRYKIDDPLDAFPVHGGCGIWGIISLAFFHKNKGIFYGHDGKQLYIQIVGIIAIVAWTAVLSSIIFKTLHLKKMLRISKEEEIKGIDYVEHGGNAYHIKLERAESVENTDQNDRHHLEIETAI